jgi:hypothetical protein
MYIVIMLTAVHKNNGGMVSDKVFDHMQVFFYNQILLFCTHFSHDR